MKKLRFAYLAAAVMLASLWDKTCAYFDSAWGFVLGNLQKRFRDGTIDWSGWLKGMKQSTAAAAKQ